VLLGIDVDCLEGRVYWSDIAGQSIKSSKYDGTDVQNFLTTGTKQTVRFQAPKLIAD
jgi:nidogen (entactin)